MDGPFSSKGKLRGCVSGCVSGCCSLTDSYTRYWHEVRVLDEDVDKSNPW